MSCNACECGTTLTTLGYGCTPEQGVTHKIIFVETYDSTGVKNKIDFADTLNQAYFDALINETDATQRWNPTPALKNIKDERGENKMYEFDDQTTEFLAEGARKFTAMIPGISGSGANSAQMKALIEGVRCGNYSVYIVSNKNQLIGKISSDGLSLEPIEIDEQSISAMFVKKTTSTPQHLILSFNFSQIENDADLRMFDCSELGDADLTSLRALVDVQVEFVSCSQTVAVVKLVSNFGTPTNPILLEGLVAADFVSTDSAATAKVYNVTDDGDLSVTVTEAAGIYSLTYASQTVADVIAVTAVKVGYNVNSAQQATV